MSHRASRLLLALAVCLSLRANPAMSEVGAERVIDEIIVTATRREAAAQDVPLSVHALSAAALERLGAHEFVDYAPAVPGLSFTHGSNGEKPVIRGVTTDQWFDVYPTVALYLDEMPITHGGGGVGPPYSPNPLLVDIERVEVLRGPQGTLFGDSAMGGAIRIVTRKPDLARAAGFVDALLTSMTDGGLGYGLHAGVNVPVSPKRVALRAVAYRRDPGGYIDNVQSGATDVNNDLVTGGRLAATARLSSDLTLSVKTLYQHQETDGSNSELPINGPRRRSGVPEPRADEWTSVNAALEYQFDGAELLFSSSRVDRRQDTNADVSAFLSLFLGIDNPMTVVNRLDSTTWTQELRVTSASDRRLQWLLGAYHQDRERFVNQDFPSPGFDALTGGMAAAFGLPDNLFVRRERETLRQLAMYGDLTFSIDDRWSLGAGVRWFDFERAFSADNRGLLFIAGAVVDGASAGNTGATPRLNVTYRPSEEVMVYATAAEGFRPGGTNRPEGSTEPACVAELLTLGLTEFPPGYDPDSLWNYELGLKSGWRNGRLQADIAIYRIDWSDLQTDKFLQCGTIFTENAGEARSTGVELRIDVIVLQETLLSFGAAYVDARLSEDVPNLNGEDGDRLPAVPQLTAHLAVSHPFTIFGRDARVYVSHAFSGRSHNGFDAATSQKLGAYHTTGARIEVDVDAWSLELFGRNLFDSRGEQFVLDNVLGSQIVTQRPRVVGLRANRAFR
ncbi:MAG: TonB-dependent receptor [Woeseiaceae bacterium]